MAAAAAPAAGHRALRGAPKAEIDLVRLIEASERAVGEAEAGAVGAAGGGGSGGDLAEAVARAAAARARLAALAARARALLGEVGGETHGGAVGVPAACGAAALGRYAAAVERLAGAEAAARSSEARASSALRAAGGEDGEASEEDEGEEEAEGADAREAGGDGDGGGRRQEETGSGSEKLSLRAAEALATHEALQDELAEELVELAASVKRNALEVKDELRKQSAVLDDADKAVEASVSGTRAANTRASEVFAQGWSASCQGLVMTMIVMVIFTLVFLLMRFAPNLDSRGGEL